jgi:ABC-type Mn2+/Zn2+ transport system permease subunit
MSEHNDEIKEDFCPACIAVPLAMAGAGIAGAGSSGAKENAKRNKIMMWVGIVIALLSLVAGLYYAYTCNTCK